MQEIVLQSHQKGCLFIILTHGASSSYNISARTEANDSFDQGLYHFVCSHTWLWNLVSWNARDKQKRGISSWWNLAVSKQTSKEKFRADGCPVVVAKSTCSLSQDVLCVIPGNCWLVEVLKYEYIMGGVAKQGVTNLSSETNLPRFDWMLQLSSERKWKVRTNILFSYYPSSSW